MKTFLNWAAFAILTPCLVALALLCLIYSSDMLHSTQGVLEWATTWRCFLGFALAMFIGGAPVAWFQWLRERPAKGVGGAIAH